MAATPVTPREREYCAKHRAARERALKGGYPWKASEVRGARARPLVGPIIIAFPPSAPRRCAAALTRQRRCRRPADTPTHARRC